MDALKEEKAAGKACGAEGKVFERDCAAQWVGFCSLFFYFYFLFFYLPSVTGMGWRGIHRICLPGRMGGKRRVGGRSGYELLLGLGRMFY